MIMHQNHHKNRSLNGRHFANSNSSVEYWISQVQTILTLMVNVLRIVVDIVWAVHSILDFQ